MKTAIEKAISENLTGAMAGELKTYLEQAEATKAELEKLKNSHQYTEQENRSLKAQIQRHDALDKRRAELATQEADLAKRELQLQHDTAKNAVLVAQAELKGYREVTGLVFRNMAVNRQITRDVGVPVDGVPAGNGYPGGPGMVLRSTDSESTTTTQG
ncbi:MAG: hypothetical protein ACREUF_19265 [Solimonas sp.]